MTPSTKTLSSAALAAAMMVAAVAPAHADRTGRIAAGVAVGVIAGLDGKAERAQQRGDGFEHIGVIIDHEDHAVSFGHDFSTSLIFLSRSRGETGFDTNATSLSSIPLLRTMSAV